MASSVDKRRAVAALAADRTKQADGGRFLKRAAIALLLLFLFAMPTLWAFGFFSAPPAVAEIKQLVDQQVVEYNRVARGEVPYGTPSSSAIFEKMRDMPREYREQIGPQMGRLWEARERAEMASYFAMPPEKRQAELDRRIKADEDRRKAWQSRWWRRWPRCRRWWTRWWRWWTRRWQQPWRRYRGSPQRTEQAAHRPVIAGATGPADGVSPRNGRAADATWAAHGRTSGRLIVRTQEHVRHGLDSTLCHVGVVHPSGSLRLGGRGH
jgi:hypothetical protein